MATRTLQNYLKSLADKATPTDADNTSILDAAASNALKKSPLVRTNAEIKTQYEANDDTNAFTDSEQTKLAGLDPTKVEAIVTKEEAFNLDAGDAGKLIRVDVGVDTDCTIRENATHEIPVNSIFIITQVGDGAVNLVASGGVIINTAGGTKTDGQFTRIELIKVDTDEWDTFGGVV